MKSILKIFPLLLIKFFTHAQAMDNLLKSGYEAEAFMQAQDYEKANAIFEQLAKRKLPDWQKSIVNYNLGTVKLAQNKTEDALKAYNKISLETVSTVSMIRYIYINRSIAYLKKAHKTQELVEKIDLYAISLNETKKTEKLDCLIKQFENNDLKERCPILPDLEILALKAEIGLEKAKNEYFFLLIQKKPTWAFGILEKNFYKLNRSIQSFISSNPSDEQQKAYRKFFLHQMNSLNTLWKKIPEFPLNSEQKTALKTARNVYQQSIESVQKAEFLQASNQIRQALQRIKEIISNFEFHQLQILLLNYQILLLQNKWTEADLQELKGQQLHVNELNSDQLKSAHQSLDSSIEYEKKSDKPASTFYLIIAFQTLSSINPIEHVKPPEILSDLLEQAWNVKKLTQLYIKMNEKPLEAQSFLEKSQKKLLKESENFMPRVLAFEREMFHSKDPKIQRCQQQPWDKIIPWFDQGYQSTLAAFNLIKEPHRALLQQTNAIFAWSEALRYFNQFSPSTPRKTEKVNKIFRLIQEMQAQDQPLRKPEKKEMHSW